MEVFIFLPTFDINIFL